MITIFNFESYFILLIARMCLYSSHFGHPVFRRYACTHELLYVQFNSVINVLDEQQTMCDVLHLSLYLEWYDRHARTSTNALLRSFQWTVTIKCAENFKKRCDRTHWQCAFRWQHSTNRETLILARWCWCQIFRYTFFPLFISIARTRFASSSMFLSRSHFLEAECIPLWLSLQMKVKTNLSISCGWNSHVTCLLKLISVVRCY